MAEESINSAEYSIDGDVAIVLLENPPVNGLGHALRKGIAEGIDKANADLGVKAVVIIGAGNAFSGGADIREFNTPAARAHPNLREVIANIEVSPKPVIAAIHKIAMGGGLELALGCHYRVASAGAQLALPEVKLGLIPGAGGTQRLPRAIGVGRALDMIVSGKPVSADSAPPGLIDEIIRGDLLAGAVAFARQAAADGRPLKKLRDVTPALENPQAVFAAARQRAANESRGFTAPLKCIDAVELSLSLPFDAGLQAERRIFDELVESAQSKALRHAFFAERQAAKLVDVPASTPILAVKRVAIVGAGTMGTGIAMAFVNAGYQVTLLDAKQEALDRGLATLRKRYASALAKGRLAQADADRRQSLVTASMSYDEIAEADLAIEAVFEDMAIKKDVFRRLDGVMKHGAILATNTSTLDVNEIAASTRRPQCVVGLHFFSPANIMRLLEIVRGRETSATVLASVMKLAKAIGKVGVVAGVCDGFIGNRMLEEYLRQAYFLVDEGASPQQIDHALQDWGMAMGPFAMMDMAGQDIGWAVRKRRSAEQPDKIYSKFIDRICELGRFGQKTGAGIYRYETGSRAPRPDPVVEDLIKKYRSDIGLAPRAIDDAEIVARCIYALVNEGARILEEGIAQRAGDIDVVYLTGYGFPAYRGGPMFHADAVGLPHVVDAMARFARGYHGELWQPAPLLAKLAATGKSFN